MVFLGGAVPRVRMSWAVTRRHCAMARGASCRRLPGRARPARRRPATLDRPRQALHPLVRVARAVHRTGQPLSFQLRQTLGSKADHLAQNVASEPLARSSHSAVPYLVTVGVLRSVLRVATQLHQQRQLVAQRTEQARNGLALLAQV